MSGLWGESSGVSIWRSEWGNMRTLQQQLDDQVAQARSSQSRMSSQLSALQGDLSHRVERLSRAFDAFVELSELRDQLTLHTDARRWRLAAKQIVETSVRRVAPVADALPELDDVAGYWLVPALRALPGVIAGHPDAELLAEAARCDEARSTMFLAAASLLMARSDVVAGWVARAMSGAPSDPISAAQRALWLAAADGEMAHTAVESVRGELRRRLEAAPPEHGRARLVADLASMPPAANPLTVARSNATPTAAIEMLRRWATWCGQVTSDHEVERDLAPSARAVAVDEPRGSDAVLDVVRSLVEEGSEPERALLDRAEELRAVVEATGATTSTTAWDAPAGTVAELLSADVRQTASRSRARFALVLVDVSLVAAADDLVAQARTGVAPSTEVVSGRRTLHVTSEGAVAAEVGAAEDDLRSEAPAGLPLRIDAVLGATLVVAVVLAASVSAGWLVLVAIAAVALLVVQVLRRRRVLASRATVDVQVERLRQRVTEATAEVASAEAAARDAASEAGTRRDEIARALGHPPAPPPA